MKRRKTLLDFCRATDELNIVVVNEWRSAPN